MNFAILLLGASLMGLGGVLVRLAGNVGVGPFGSAFWRMALASVVLVGWALWQRQRSRGKRRAVPAADAELEPALEQPAPAMPVWLHAWSQSALIAVAACMFAGDLILYHLGLFWTTVANATLESNLAPVVITVALWAMTGAAPSLSFLFGMGTALVGAMIMIGAHLGHGTALLGDRCGLSSALFYAAYQLSVQQARQRLETLPLMAWVSSCAALALLPFAWGEGRFLPAAAIGWLWLVGLALVVQIGGQVVVAHAIKHLNPRLASVGLLMQPATAAVYAWVILGQAMSAVQIGGAVLALGGIYLARRAG
ncbi:MAG: DMT family transporter [Betaproteobacteria bacterium]|nr:DMT family transporter [Betaproteobacteria bacterium]